MTDKNLGMRSLQISGFSILIGTMSKFHMAFLMSVSHWRIGKAGRSALREIDLGVKIRVSNSYRIGSSVGLIWINQAMSTTFTPFPQSVPLTQVVNHTRDLSWMHTTIFRTGSTSFNSSIVMASHYPPTILFSLHSMLTTFAGVGLSQPQQSMISYPDMQRRLDWVVKH